MDTHETDFYGVDTLRLAMVGMTGTGKSALGNSILAWGWLKLGDIWGKMTRPFKSQGSSESVTVNCKKQEAVILGYKIALVDTPGLLDTKIAIEETLTELLKCICLLTPGPHAILLVIRIGRFTPEVIKGVELMQKVFGEESVNHMIIVFTGADSLENDGISIQTFVDEIRGPCRNLLEKCGMRFIAVNNTFRPTSDENKEQISKLLSMVLNITKSNGGKCYSNKYIEQAKELMAEEKENLLKQREEEERTKNDAENDRKRLEEEVNKLKLEAEENKEKLNKEETKRKEEETKRKEEETKRKEEETKRKEEEQKRKDAEERAANNVSNSQAGKEVKEEIKKEATKDGGCFASDGKVRVEEQDGRVTIKTLADLKVGDHVQSFDPKSNSIIYSPVYYIIYQDENKRVSTLQELFYEDGTGKEFSLRIQAKHLVYSTASQDMSTSSDHPPSTPTMSEKVSTNDILWVADDNDQLCPRRVTKIGEVVTTVRHPMTLNHFIIVDDVLASVHMHNEWVLRQATAPLRLLYNISPSLSDFWIPKKAVQAWDYVEKYILE